MECRRKIKFKIVSELFCSPGTCEESPLADRMRPRVLDDIIGQDHIVGPGRLLRRAIQADRLSSVIFYGPPGTGKTSLAKVIANTTRGVFENLNAVLTGIKDIREVIDRSDERLRLYARRTILFVDEVHRWNKAQQDALLPWVENGTVILVGATTENPFFEVNRALVSRSRIFQLKSLDSEALLKTAERALQDKERGYGNWKVIFEDGALDHLVEVAGGDARSLLNALELAIETSPAETKWPPPPGSEIHVSMEAAEESIQRRALLYDRDGDYHFDTISAFIKSVRGSDPDASLYWLAKMTRAGEDPAFLFRRMIILAMEDVGLADPAAISTVIACAEAFDRIGFPEGNFALSEACLRLATAPKSNTTMAFFDALKEVEKEDADIPAHLRDPNRDKESFGHGEGYIYPHAYREHWAAQAYLPPALRGRIFYNPSLSGHEGIIRDEVLRKREIQAAVILDMSQTGSALQSSVLNGSAREGQDAQEILSWSSNSKGKEGWFKRLESGRSGLLLSDRTAVFGQCSIARHHRVLIPAANDGLLLWESQRLCPEGLVAALVDTIEQKDTLYGLSAVLDEAERPIIEVLSELPSPEKAEELFSCRIFDHIVSREPWRRFITARGRANSISILDILDNFALSAKMLLADGGTISILQSPPSRGERISRILQEECDASQGCAASQRSIASPDLTEKLAKAEDEFFGKTINSDVKSEKTTKLKDNVQIWNWDAETLEKSFEKAGFNTGIKVLEQSEDRLITTKDLATWFDREKSVWGAAISAALDEKDFYEVQKHLENRIKQGPIKWKWKSLLLKAIKK